MADPRNIITNFLFDPLSNPLDVTTGVIFFLLAATIVSVGFIFYRLQPKQTKLVFYVHDYLTGNDSSAITIAGKEGPASSVLQFGTLVAVDDAVTEGPDLGSKQIGRAQGLYINSALDGKALYMFFSVIFTDGQFKGSTLEIQGSDIFSMEEREFGIVSGTGHFRFVKGYGILETAFMDLPNLRAVLKINVTAKHY